MTDIYKLNSDELSAVSGGFPFEERTDILHYAGYFYLNRFVGGIGKAYDGNTPNYPTQAEAESSMNTGIQKIMAEDQTIVGAKCYIRTTYEDNSTKDRHVYDI